MQGQEHNPERLAEASFLSLVRGALHLPGCGLKHITLLSHSLGSGPSLPISLTG